MFISAFFLLTLREKDTINVVVLLQHKDDIELMYIDGYQKYCYFMLVDLIVDFEEKVLL